MAQGIVKVFRLRIRYNAQDQPAELVEVDTSFATAELGIGDQTYVESWIRNGGVYNDVMAPGDEFIVVYSTEAWDPSTPMSALANQAGGVIAFWRDGTYWSEYD
jgi:hypothetical protein